MERLPLKSSTRKEHDYWLSFGDAKTATAEERQEFLDYDSHGGSIMPTNPILVGKRRYGQYGEVLRAARLDRDGGWEGGLYFLESYQHREPFGLRPLIEWFGWDAVMGWACELLWSFRTTR